MYEYFSRYKRTVSELRINFSYNPAFPAVRALTSGATGGDVFLSLVLVGAREFSKFFSKPLTSRNAVICHLANAAGCITRYYERLLRLERSVSRAQVKNRTA